MTTLTNPTLSNLHSVQTTALSSADQNSTAQTAAMPSAQLTVEKIPRLTPGELRKPLPRRYKEFVVPYQGESRLVRIRSLTERERNEYEQFTQLGNEAQLKLKRKEAKLRLIQLCVVNEENQPMLSLDDAKRMQEQDGGFIGALFGQCLDHCLMKTTELQDLEKNFEETADD